MNLLSIGLIGLGFVAIGGGVLMATRPEQAARVERRITGRVTVEQGGRWGIVTLLTIVLLVASA
jgi:hypothetical protein